MATRLAAPKAPQRAVMKAVQRACHWADHSGRCWAESWDVTKVELKDGPRADLRVVLWVAPLVACSVDLRARMLVVARAESLVVMLA